MCAADSLIYLNIYKVCMPYSVVDWYIILEDYVFGLLGFFVFLHVFLDQHHLLAAGFSCFNFIMIGDNVILRRGLFLRLGDSARLFILLLDNIHFCIDLLADLLLLFGIRHYLCNQTVLFFNSLLLFFECSSKLFLIYFEFDVLII